MHLTEAFRLLREEIGEDYHYSIDCETWDRGQGITVEFSAYTRHNLEAYQVSADTLEEAVSKLIVAVNGLAKARDPHDAEGFMAQAEMADSRLSRDRATAQAEDAQERNEQDRIDADRDAQDVAREVTHD